VTAVLYGQPLSVHTCARPDTSRPTTSSRPSNPLNPSPLAPQIRLCWPLCSLINYIYLHTYVSLLPYLPNIWAKTEFHSFVVQTLFCDHLCHLPQWITFCREQELDSENEVPPTVVQPPGTLFLPTSTTLLTPVHSENDSRVYFMIVLTTDWACCWRSWTCRIVAPYIFHVDWLIDWLTLHFFLLTPCNVIWCDCSSVGIYLDTVNIFIRIAMILAGGGSRRK